MSRIVKPVRSNFSWITKPPTSSISLASMTFAVSVNGALSTFTWNRLSRPIGTGPLSLAPSWFTSRCNSMVVSSFLSFFPPMVWHPVNSKNPSAQHK